jgi:hypothetical protein
MHFGFKANAVCIDGTWRDVAKSPTGDAVKKSEPGRLAPQRRNGHYRTVPAIRSLPKRTCSNRCSATARYCGCKTSGNSSNAASVRPVRRHPADDQWVARGDRDCA